MKVEIEISEEAVNKALQEKIATAIRLATQTYPLDRRVCVAVNEAIEDRLDNLIKAQIADTPAIEAAVRKAIEKKLRSRLHKLLNEEQKP